MTIPVEAVSSVAAARTPRATSSGAASRASGVCSSMCRRRSGAHSRVSSVSTRPGATASTRMRGASARASDLVRLLSAAFDAQ